MLTVLCHRRPHTQDAESAQKRQAAAASVQQPASTASSSAGADNVMMPPPPPSASKKTPLKSPSAATNTAAAKTYEIQPLLSSLPSFNKTCTANSGTAHEEKAAEQQKKKPKKVPEWAQGANLQEALRGEQMYRYACRTYPRRNYHMLTCWLAQRSGRNLWACADHMQPAG